jgi:hypothetical protein
MIMVVEWSPVRWAIVQYSIWRNRYGEVNISIHQALIGNVGELTGQTWTWGFLLYFLGGFEYDLGERERMTR